jgi:hypothetical protein
MAGRAPQMFRPSSLRPARHLHVGLDLLEALLELLPVVHDGLALGLLGEQLGHGVHLLLAVLDAVDADCRNVSINSKVTWEASRGEMPP